jgi:hypothetical protein
MDIRNIVINEFINMKITNDTLNINIKTRDNINDSSSENTIISDSSDNSDQLGLPIVVEKQAKKLKVYNCVCGSTIQKKGKRTHEQSKRHLNYIAVL